MSANTTGAYATYWISEDTRRMCFKHGVEVNQDTDYESDNMSKPEIRLHSYWDDTNYTTMLEIADALKRAVEIARLWDKDTGRDLTEVKTGSRFVVGHMVRRIIDWGDGKPWFNVGEVIEIKDGIATCTIWVDQPRTITFDAKTGRDACASGRGNAGAVEDILRSKRLLKLDCP